MIQLPPTDTSTPAPSSESNTSTVDWLSISMFSGVGRATVNRLVEMLGSPAHVLSAKPNKLMEIEGIGRKLADKLTNPSRIQAARLRAKEVLEGASGNNCKILCPDNKIFPSGLKNIHDAPVVLYCKGQMECLEKPAIAIVGSRAATTYGKRISFELGRELARNGICVVSGMAMGIDGEAHAGALAGGGVTIGVLGCGVDVVYPHQHTALFKKVCERGMLVSEYPPGTSPDGFRFPERNRIISGISLGTVVVEASLKSGSLITARMALDQGREVFAVPGRIDSPKSQGAHRLLQQGAKLVTSVDDILEELDMAGVFDSNPTTVSSGSMNLELKENEKHLLSFLDVYPVTIDELVRESGYDATTVFQVLLRLELKGVVRQLPGQQYEMSMHLPT